MLILLTVLLVACGEKEPVKIGFIAGTSGRVADLGVGGRNGVILATEKINSSGGIDGRKIELVLRDDQQDPVRARAAAEYLVAENVKAILGPMTSSMAREVVPYGNKHRLVIFGGTVATNELTGKDDYFFRVIAPTRQYASASAKYQIDRGLRRFVVAYDLRNSAYTESWLNDYRAAIEQGGGKVIKAISFESSNNVPFDRIVSELLGAAPDCVVLASNSVDTANFVQQVRKRNKKVALAASEWAGTERFIQLAGRAAEGVVLGQYLDRYGTQPAYQEFRRDYLKRFSQEPGYPGLVSYNAAMVLYKAIAHQRPDEDLKQALLRIRSYDGLQEPITFDAYGDANARPYIIKVQDGKFVLAE